MSGCTQGSLPVHAHVHFWHLQCCGQACCAVTDTAACVFLVLWILQREHSDAVLTGRCSTRSLSCHMSCHMERDHNTVDTALGLTPSFVPALGVYSLNES
jgi:hypothetical protein